MIECVVNISEGRDAAVLGQLATAVQTSLLDVHADVDHHRSVFTLAGTDGARTLTEHTVEHLDIGSHSGEHPRLGVVDVVPFVPLGDATMHDALAARNAFAHWASNELGVPCFLYGAVGDTERTLPDVRRHAWHGLAPDTGPSSPHPTAGAICVGARRALIAYNVLLDSTDIGMARGIAREVRRPGLRTLAFTVNGRAQVSMNIVDTDAVTVADAFDAVSHCAGRHGITTLSGELVGLVPRQALDKVDPQRWNQLDLGNDKTIEWRLNRLSM